MENEFKYPFTTRNVHKIMYMSLTTNNLWNHIISGTPYTYKHERNVNALHSILGYGILSRLGINISHMDRYDYNENIKYREKMFPTRSLHSSQQKPIQSQ